MSKTQLQLSHEIQQLHKRVVHWGKLEDQVKLDAAIAQYRKIMEDQQKEKDELQEIVEGLKRESIFED